MQKGWIQVKKIHKQQEKIYCFKFLMHFDGAKDRDLTGSLPIE